MVFVMNTKKHHVCKICNKPHMARGFCKTHHNAFLRNNIDFNGKPKDGYFLDEKLHLKKIKNNLAITVKESVWYRSWLYTQKQLASCRCQKCGRRGISLCVHHHKKRFAIILNEAKERFDNLSEQLVFIRQQHTNEIALVLCRDCHAEQHLGEKMYSSLLGRKQSNICLVCGEEAYCRSFCEKHYHQWRVKIISSDGSKIRPLRNELSKSQCIICGEQTVGCSGVNGSFCLYHRDHYRRGVVDIHGQVIRKLKSHIRKKYKPITCKICPAPYFGLGFCSTHYNRYKIGQIDKDGKQLRVLGVFNTRKA